MATNDILEAFGADEATWKAAKAAVSGRVDLSDTALEVPALPVPRDLSDCVLKRSKISAATGDVIRLDVSGADLTKAEFAEGSRIELTISDTTVLDETVFASVRISNTDFRPAKLKGVNFHQASLRSVRFRSTLNDVNFGRSRLHDVSFAGATLLRCNLASTNAYNCEFSNVIFSKTKGESGTEHEGSLEKAAFIESSFVYTDFGDYYLTYSQFIKCDLRWIKGLVLDNTVMRDTVLSPDASDKWSVLRRKYTGANMLFNLIFLVIFFVPFIFSTVYLTAVNRLQLSAVHGASALDAELAKAPPEELPVALRLGLKRLMNPELVQCLEPQQTSGMQSNPACLPIWKILLGVHEGPLALMLSVILLIYNLCRMILTLRVAPLRDEERDYFHSPAQRDYGWLIYLHYAVKGLFYMAIAAAFAHLTPRLMLPVWLSHG